MKIIITTCLLFVCHNALMAQVNVQNTGTLYIASATDTFFVAASFTNSSGAALTNNGSFYVKQDISNAQTSMAVATGTLYLNGSSAQAINGTQTFKTFNLVTNNAAGISLNNNLSVSGTHTYTAGMIITSATPNYMIYEAGSSYTGSSDSRHVNGWVKKIGNTNFVFPVGSATYERPVALTNLTASGEFNAKYSRTTPNRISVYNPLVYVDSAEYWTINKISGSAAQVVMNWDDSKVHFPNFMITDIRATNYDGTFWRIIGSATATGSSLTTGTVTSSSVSIFNRNFTIGSTAFVLPIKIISFTAGRMSDYTKLNWTIGNELNIASYELQRSDDGINFYTIYTHAPFNRNGTEFYSYDDRKILTGTAFYRLKINDLSTQINYSHIVTVSANATDKTFYVITNPVDASIELYAGAGIKGLYNYMITNTGGQVMQSGTLDIKTAGTYSIYLKPFFAAGAYILVVQNEANRLQKMIIKK